MSPTDIAFVAAVVTAFCVFGLVLAWGARRTATLPKD